MSGVGSLPVPPEAVALQGVSPGFSELASGACITASLM